MARSAGAAFRGGPEEAQLAIRRFLQSSRKPILQEPGEDAFLLTGDSFHIECRNGRLLLETWDERRHLSRRVLGIAEERPGRLGLHVERFGKKTGSILLLDEDRASNQTQVRRGERLVFREQVRRMLARAFAGWNIREISAEPDLEHSLSPSFVRAFLTSGGSGMAAIASPADADEPGGALTFGLIWLDYLRRRERRVTVEGLALFLPAGKERTACLRLSCLNPRAARFEVFVHAPGGGAGRIDPRDYGNLDTRLDACRIPSAESQVRLNPLVERIQALPNVETIERGEGSMCFRVRGLEVASVAGGKVWFGIDSRRPAADGNFPEIAALAAELSRLRSPDAADRNHPLLLRAPEAWLESQIRRSLQTVDATLLPNPVYGQVPAIAGVDRGVLDLLAVDDLGRLAVLELKASSDLHLPLQALDYWMRVAWHVERGDFTRLGYFPGIRLQTTAPRLLLIAPALEFHPTTETVLRFLSPHVPVERVGLGIEWQKRLQVVLRLQGAGVPC